ncbi:hypothetical protein [Ancylobacter sp. G4_0304]
MLVRFNSVERGTAGLAGYERYSTQVDLRRSLTDSVEKVGVAVGLKS